MKKKKHPYWNKFNDLNEAYSFLTLLPTEDMRLFTDTSFKGFVKGKIFAYFQMMGSNDIENYGTPEHKEGVKIAIFDELDKFFFHSESKKFQYCCYYNSGYQEKSVPTKDMKELLQISEFTAQYKLLVKLIGHGPDENSKNYIVEKLIEREFWKDIKRKFLNIPKEDEDVNNPHWYDDGDDYLDDDEYIDESDW